MTIILIFITILIILGIIADHLPEQTHCRKHGTMLSEKGYDRELYCRECHEELGRYHYE